MSSKPTDDEMSAFNVDAVKRAMRATPKLKEVQYDHSTGPGNKPEYGPQCPHCGARTERSIIPCPDGPKEIAPGVWQQCCVIHHGWACRCCYPTRYFKEEP